LPNRGVDLVVGAVRVVVCDADPLLREVVEAVLVRAGHDVVGVADNTAAGTRLVRAARPDTVIVDLSLGYNTDFDIIESAVDVDARVIVFSHNADHAVLDRYSPRPTVVAKPDLAELERAIARAAGTGDGATAPDRRRRPGRAAQGPPPTGPTDAQAFYEALGNAAEGDALLSVGPGDLASVIVKLVRGSDRVLHTGSKVMVFLPGAGEEGIDAFVTRVVADVSDASVKAIVVAVDESGADAFARLKSSGEERRPPA
jgi:CheY-like chemotaxis protein